MYYLSFLCSLQKEQQWLRKAVKTLLTNPQEKGPEDEQMDHARKQNKKWKLNQASKDLDQSTE